MSELPKGRFWAWQLNSGNIVVSPEEPLERCEGWGVPARHANDRLSELMAEDYSHIFGEGAVPKPGEARLLDNSHWPNTYCPHCDYETRSVGGICGGTTGPEGCKAVLTSDELVAHARIIKTKTLGEERSKD